MESDENEFFRQATLRICSSLDVEKALFNFLQYICLFMPASKVCLGVFEPSTGTLAGLRIVDSRSEKEIFASHSTDQGSHSRNQIFHTT